MEVHLQYIHQKMFHSEIISTSDHVKIIDLKVVMSEWVSCLLCNYFVCFLQFDTFSPICMLCC